MVVGPDPVLYGHVDLSPRGAFEVRSLQAFTLTYTVGRFGLHDGGAIRIVFHAIGDTGRLQTSDPSGENYVTVTTSGSSNLSLEFDGRTGARPRRKSLTIRVSGGYFNEGDTITVLFGGMTHGSPSMRLQTFVEEGFEFKILADVCAVGHFTPIPDAPAIAIVLVLGQSAAWRAALFSLRRPGERFQFGL